MQVAFLPLIVFLAGASLPLLVLGYAAADTARSERAKRANSDVE